MHNHADQHGSLPAAAIYSPDGKPLLSWRVALLPFLGQQDLYDQFKQEEPWDSAHNLALLPKMPSVFEHFHGRVAPAPHTTYYRIFFGPGAAFEGPRGISLQDFPDGTGLTLLIVEASDAVPWTQPAELAIVPECSLPALGGHFPDVFVTAFADGSIRTLKNGISDKKLRAVITRNGGEEVDLDEP